MRRRACAQPGRLRRARRKARLRHQRLRRDHPRPLRMGPEAHGGLAGAGRARSGTQGQLRAHSRPGLHRALRRADTRVFPDAATGGEPVSGAPHRPGHAGARGARQGRARHAAAHAGAADRAGFLAARSAAPLQGIEAHADARRGRTNRGGAGFAGALSRDAGAAAATSARLLPARGCGVQGGGQRLRGPARLLRVYGRQRRRRSALFADQGRGCVGLRAVSARCAARRARRPARRRGAEVHADPDRSWAGRTSATASI